MCENNLSNDNNISKDVPYIVHEGIISRMERMIKRMWILIVFSIFVIFSTNAVWIWYINQYDYYTYGAYADDGGDANIIGRDGDIENGLCSDESES